MDQQILSRLSILSIIDNANNVNTINTGNTGNAGNTGNTSNTSNTGNTGNTGNTENTENTAKHFVRLGEVVIFCNIQERLSDFLKFEERLCDFSITLRRGCMILCNILDLIVLSSDTIVTSLYSTYIFIIIK